MSEPRGISPRLAELAGEMRSRGASVGTGELLAAHRALGAVDPADRNIARLAMRATLCASPRDLEIFDSAFPSWILAGMPDPGAPPLDDIAKAVLPRVAIPAGSPPPTAPGDELDARPAPWSSEELLRTKDFADYTDSERRLARSLLERLARRGPTRLSLRTRTTRSRSHRPDSRATVRAAIKHGGEPVDRFWRRQVSGQRPFVLVLDVSGSMEPYSRMLLQYAQACVAARRRCEAFVFGTRLTRITGELGGRDPDRALARAGEAVEDWSGGTRIGESLGELNRVHGRRVGRGAVVAVLSDGWDRGEPEELSAEVARLGRCSHHLVWLNPLKASPGFEPLTRGMTAALPHVDTFMAGNTMASLETLAMLLESGIRKGGGL